jgi:hypothetical protein
MTTLKQALEALEAVGLKDIRVIEGADGNIYVSLNRKLGDDQSTLIEFEDALVEDPE